MKETQADKVPTLTLSLAQRHHKYNEFADFYFSKTISKNICLCAQNGPYQL